MQRPAHLKPGDTIGICAPSSPCPPEELASGAALLKARGYNVVVAPNTLKTAEHCTYLAGSDSERAADLNGLFADNSIDAIFCARGGYGAMRMLHLIDWDAVRAKPKLLSGYSDITSVHLALGKLGDQVSFYGPNLTTLESLDTASSCFFWNMVEGTDGPVEIPASGYKVQTIVPGIAEGALAGGCLCLLAHAVGSPFTPDFCGKLVLIEDVNDSVYHADRDLTQLRNAGLLDDAAGFIIGTLTHWQKHEADPPQNSPEALWRDILGPLGKPTICGFPFGHEPNPRTMPLGVPVRLDADQGTVTLLEAALK